MSNYNFAPTLDGLNNIDGNSINSNTVITDYLTVNLGSSVPTLAPATNNNSIASTAFVQSLISTIPTNYVTTDTTQTLTTGIKTFTNLPECSAVPVSNNQLVNKNYVDNSIPTNYVTTDTTQTLTTGVKTFTNLPECSAVPVSNNQLVNKDYVDNKDFVNLTTNQTITSGIKTFNDNVVIGSGINTKTGSNLTLTTTGGEDVVINGSNDITFNSAFNTVFNASAYGSFQAGIGYTFVNNGSYGFKFIDNGTGGGFESTTNNNIVNTSVNNIDYNSASVFGTYYAGAIRGAIYNNTAYNVPTFTFANGQSTDIGVTFNALNVIVPIGNTCNMVRVSIPFDLLAWATFGLPAGSGNVGLRFDSFTVVYLKNGSAFTPPRSEATSSAIGVTKNWAKTGTQSNISGISSYFGNLDIAFNIDINNTSVDTYQVRVNPQATITNYSINFDNFKFVCRNATGGQTNGNGFTTTRITSFTGGTLVFDNSNPTFVDTSVNKLGLSYPVPPTTASCYMPLNNNITPAGMISQYAGSSAPAGWLLCNGGSYNIVDYPNLYAVISNMYGGSLGAGTFSVPDCRGIFVAGSGSQVISGNTYTRSLGTKQAHQLQDHKHTYSDLLWWDTNAGGGNGQTTFVANASHQVPNGDDIGSNGDGDYSNRLTKKTYPSTAVNPSGSQWLEPTNVSALTGTDTYPANIAFNYIVKW
jgi:hypothetical protein